jgi:riboflavin biosynthesis pyrimidine reductase
MANILLGFDESTVKNGSSKPLTFPSDRKRFHEIRANSDVIIIGGETARREPYESTPVPLIVLSRSLDRGSAKVNPLAITWNQDISSAITRAKQMYSSILIEAGISLLLPALEGRCVDTLHVTLSLLASEERSPVQNSARSSHHVTLSQLTAGYVEVERKSLKEGVFLTYNIAPSHN